MHKKSGGWPTLSNQDSSRGCPTPSTALRAGSSRVLGGRVGSGQEHDTHLFSPPRGPLRFDLDHPFLPRGIVNKTTPFPVLWPLHQSALDRIAMHVAQLLDAFRFAPYGKIIVADLPKAREMFGVQLL